MRKSVHIATRDFLATVSTKGFIIAILAPVLVYAAMILIFPTMMNSVLPPMTGEISVIDESGQVIEGVRAYLDPRAIAERRNAALARGVGAPPDGGLMPGMPGLNVDGAQSGFRIIQQTPDALTAEKERLKRSAGEGRLVAVVVVPASAIMASRPEDLTTYELFVASNVDSQVHSEIRNAVHEAMVDARLRADGLDPKRVAGLIKVERRRSVTVTATGESPTVASFNRMLPMGFMVLLMLSVMSSGQYLLTTTIEEKSSRTMEVILSAVSPLELLTGKILGQMVVGLLLLVTYASLAILGLVSIAMFGLLDMSLLFYLFIFFLITYVMVGSMMAAVGAAVNELREAQSLMTPITLMIMATWVFWPVISRDPNSVFATVASFVPPMNAFAMLLRLTSTSPPPAWQVWLSIGIGAAAAAGALWFASRVFRIGLLMHGRPPNLATLIKWARQA